MIKILKLVTGEEIIGDVTHGSTLQIDKPCLIQLVPSRANPDQPAVALIPYGFYTKNHRINVHNDTIIWSEEPMEELYNQYNSIFGSGLVVANRIN